MCTQEHLEEDPILLVLLLDSTLYRPLKKDTVLTKLLAAIIQVATNKELFYFKKLIWPIKEDSKKNLQKFKDTLSIMNKKRDSLKKRIEMKPPSVGTVILPTLQADRQSMFSGLQSIEYEESFPH